MAAQARAATPKTSKMALSGSSKISLMAVESLKAIFDVVAVVLLFLTFAAGVGVLITGNIINKRQEEQLRKFDKDLKDKDLKIAEVQKEAEDERLARVKIEERIAWRTITETQRRKIKDVLSKFKGQAFDIDGSNVDPEMDSFSEEIRDSLGKAGWVPNNVGRWGSATSWTGIQILVNPRTPLVPAATALRDLLISPDFGFKDIILGVDAESTGPVPWTPVKPNEVAIHPGRKPQP